jgi:hypothetical protein
VLKRVSIQKVRLFFLVNLHILVELSDIIVHLNLQEKLLLQFRQHIGLERVLGYMLVLKTINYWSLDQFVNDAFADRERIYFDTIHTLFIRIVAYILNIIITYSSYN